MNNLKVIIIDDEPSARENLSLLLKRFVPNVIELGSFSNLLDGVAFIKNNKVDLVFLDVDMPNYAGYEIVNFIDNIDFEIIFITAYDKYAVKAFELSATDYLLKPVDIQRLKNAVKKAENNFRLLQDSKQLEQVTQTITPNFKNKIKIFNKFIDPTSITAIEAQGAYSKLYFDDQTNHLVSKSLAQLERDLNEHEFFFRSHKSWLINLNHVVKLNNSQYTIELNNEVLAKVSRYKIQEFKSRFK